MFAGKRPTNLGVREARLNPCPDTPNCVCSYDTNPQHQIQPLAYTSEPQKALADLKTVIQSMPKAQIVTENSNYLHAEFTSALMGFVDDVEFYLDETAKVIHVRSASRLGRSDLGVNRKRVEMIRDKLQAVQA